MRIRIGLLLLVWFGLLVTEPLASTASAQATATVDVIDGQDSAPRGDWSLRSATGADLVSAPPLYPQRMVRSRPIRLRSLLRPGQPVLASGPGRRSSYPERSLLQRRATAIRSDDDPPS